ncbi:unnamed protein product [Pedinophyceae sp. YPF-701]|nr:unnamed protein product [Pedinophyceae sp. YPF-701]
MAGFQLPNLPGFRVHEPVYQGQALYKKQTLTVSSSLHTDGGGPLMVVDPPKAVHPDALVPKGTLNMTGHMVPEGVPRWKALDGKVLRFYGFFKEGVVEDPVENHRVRRVVIYYYLAKDEIQVLEEKTLNSGIPQGNLIKRGACRRADGELVSTADFRVGGTLELHGKVFLLVDCDGFTRAFYEEAGDPQPASVDYPADPLATFRAARAHKTRAPPKPRNDVLTRFVEARLGRPSSALEDDTRGDFLTKSGSVLRYYAIWDDRGVSGGERRPYIIHMYLEDHAVEILEVHEPNDGREPFPLFLRRTRLPLPNVHRADALSRLPKSHCLAPQHLKIGAKISVFGREFEIFDSDKFTRDWSIKNLGRTAAQTAPIDVRERAPTEDVLVVPPWNGYGSLADSMQNCLTLLPKPPKRDFRKMMLNEKTVLRFRVRMIAYEGTAPLAAADADRRLVLTYYTADDTLSIFEPPMRNSGIIGGKFLEKQEVFKPGTTQPVLAQDLWVGAAVIIHCRAFQILDADEFTLRYMEANPDAFPMSDADAVSLACKEAAQGKAEALRAAVGSAPLSVADVARVFEHVGIDMTAQEILTLYRSLGGSELSPVSPAELLGALGAAEAPAPAAEEGGGEGEGEGEGGEAAAE